MNIFRTLPNHSCSRLLFDAIVETIISINLHRLLKLVPTGGESTTVTVEINSSTDVAELLDNRLFFRSHICHLRSGLHHEPHLLHQSGGFDSRIAISPIYQFQGAIISGPDGRFTSFICGEPQDDLTS
ncbi:hypothetical protein RRG08_062074 [Elysia crispata]|uniref:Uncharacterized protein n=1 Tax=Elysia crispata TaxID=231223 RepID=A0AAE0ZHX5_9GAST|nr:hypothetical protein RRG08_062074 [Elysia crispata]